MFRRIRLLLAAVIAASGCGSPAAAPSPHVAIAADPVVAAETTSTGARRLPLVRRNGFLLAPVAIDDRPVGEFLVDTGAGATFVDRGLADALHLPAVIDTRVQGAVASDAAEIRELHHLAAGGIELVAAPTVALDLSEVQAGIGSSVAGAIGFPTFGTAPFTLDFVDATLTVHDPARFTPPAGWNHPRVAGRIGIGLLEDLRITIHPVTRRIWVTP